MGSFTPTDRSAVRRLAQRASYDSSVVYGILDEGLICHVGFILDGHPRVIPTGYVRVGAELYMHGSAASTMLRTAVEENDICVTVTLLDGLVLARSAFHHSMNYRSVVIFGKARIVDEMDEKLTALRAFSEHSVPGRWEEVRKPSDAEMKKTMVICLPLVEASAKIRSGPPLDDDEDLDSVVWAGEIPLRLVAQPPVADPAVRPGVAVPAYASSYKRPARPQSG